MRQYAQRTGRRSGGQRAALEALVRITLNGTVHEIEPEQARARLGGHPPEAIQTHWVEMDGRRWPPKQALEVVIGVQRREFTSSRLDRPQ